MHRNLVTLREALTDFTDASETQSQSHIKPLHWHIATRLVIEGGFNPDDVIPRPPLRIESVGPGKRKRHRLIYDPDYAMSGELTILGGLKTKSVDVVVSKRGLGPCIAISVKGTLKAFRNLTNRMEEAAGDCTNIHITYPNLIYGFFHVLRANHEPDVKDRNDVAIDATGSVVGGIIRYHDAIARLAGRRDVRNDVSRYEAVCVAIVDRVLGDNSTIIDSFPQTDSPVRYDRFFETIYQLYDLRYVYTAPALRTNTERMAWVTDSPALELKESAAFDARVDEGDA